ncbi:hypothetical protein MKW94_015369 [Papaver nudicaule]|uniref:F-box domain-containing protein n=1 Tax=Papaver nudicaule TaxID=74823 RepID=A0AA41VBE7_PAPNU|nr:hypothetical protein [Papaver nudicaule]
MEILSRLPVEPLVQFGKTNYCLGVGDSLDNIETHVCGTFPDEIVKEILSRVPVKPLMQFKSVCKHWQSFIKHDRHFIDLHFNRLKSRPNLLYINTVQQKGLSQTNPASFKASKTLQQSISCGDIVEGSGGEEQVQAIASKVRITDDKWFLYDQVLEPVNGLVCFVDSKTRAICVHNASTREATPWVKSMLLEEENDRLANINRNKVITIHSSPIYQFGFDTEKREHKVFCFWRLVARSRRHVKNSMEKPDYECWEALTIGRDTQWRRINAVPNENNLVKLKDVLPPAYSSYRQVYEDGTIYWSNKEYYSDQWGDSNPNDPDVIVAFDVGGENYRVIPIPEFILDEPRDKDFRLPIGMLVLGGHITLLYRMEPHVVKLWMLDDTADKKLENCRGNTSNWSTETITLPFCCDKRVGGFGIAGSTDKILFEFKEYKDSVTSICLYSYDRRKKTCKKIEMDGVSSFNLYSGRSLLTTFTESLFPVQQSKS